MSLKGAKISSSFIRELLTGAFSAGSRSGAHTPANWAGPACLVRFFHFCSFAPLAPSFILPRSPTSLPWIGQVLTFDEKKPKNEKIRDFKNFHKIWKKVQELIKKFTNLKKSSSIKKNRFWKNENLKYANKCFENRTQISDIPFILRVNYVFQKLDNFRNLNTFFVLWTIFRKRI